MNKLEKLRSEIIEDLNSMTPDGDQERDHIVADHHLTRMLRALGEHDVAKRFELARDRCGFWYA